MKKIFWNVQIEMYEDGTVNAAVVKTLAAAAMPRDVYVRNPGREVFGLWYWTEAAAQDAVIEAKTMSKKQAVAA
jgi:hypothetical protein